MFGIIIFFQRLLVSVVGPAQDLDFSLQFKDTVLQHFDIELVFALSSYFCSPVGNHLPLFAFADLFLSPGAFTEIIPFNILKVKMLRFLKLRLLCFELYLLVFFFQRSKKRP
jgi:hypothetical protein